MKLIRRLQYFNEVMEKTASLLLLYVDDVEREVPGIRVIINENFAHQIIPSRLAIVMSSALLARSARVMTREERLMCLQQLKTFEFRLINIAMGAYDNNNETGKDIFRSEFGHLTTSTLSFVSAMAKSEQWLWRGEVHEQDVYRLKTEIVGALKGYSPADRAALRMNRAGVRHGR